MSYAQSVSAAGRDASSLHGPAALDHLLARRFFLSCSARCCVALESAGAATHDGMIVGHGDHCSARCSSMSFAYAWFIRWITEFAVTDRRVIYKRGFISRHTDEMNMDKVESVDVDQSILGRLLDYGTVRDHGHRRHASETRTPRGIGRIASPPLALRNAITAK